MGTHQILGLSHRISRYLLTLHTDFPYVPALEIMYWIIAHTSQKLTGSLLGKIVNWETVALHIIPSSCLGLLKNALGASTHPVFQDESLFNQEILKVGEVEYFCNRDSCKTIPAVCYWLTLFWKLSGSVLSPWLCLKTITNNCVTTHFNTHHPKTKIGIGCASARMEVSPICM